MVLLADLLAIGFAARIGLGSGRDLALLAVLVACDAATIEVYRRAGENAGVIRGLRGLGTPDCDPASSVYALTVPILRHVLAQWRIRQFPVHRRAFSAAVIGLSYGAASLAFHAVTGSPLATTVMPGTHTSALDPRGRARWDTAVDHQHRDVASGVEGL